MKTKLKEVPGDKCPRMKDGKHLWDYFIQELLPPHIEEMRRCERCGAMQSLLRGKAKGKIE